MLEAVIDDIAAIAKFLHDGIGLFCDVDLKADMPKDVVRVEFGDGNDGDEIDERGTVLAIVCESSLTFFVSDEMFSERGYCV